MNKISNLLSQMELGDSVAEQESDEIFRYFVQTQQWRDLVSGEVDIIYGAKGSGKSALFAAMRSQPINSFHQRPVLLFGENPTGATAFASLKNSPSSTETNYVFIWKCYVLAHVASHLQEVGCSTDTGREALNSVIKSGLLPRGARTPATLLEHTLNYVRDFKPDAIEPTVKLDPSTGVPVGIGVKVSLRANEGEKSDVLSVDELLRSMDAELCSAGTVVWILLDRLDVAFDLVNIEIPALRALFRAYRDLITLRWLRLKIFIRSDVWERLTRFERFSEATHYTRCTTITWSNSLILNLIMRRLLANGVVMAHYKVDPKKVLSSYRKQKKLWYRIFPDEIDGYPSFDWLLLNTRDGSEEPSPRDVIELLRTARGRQIRQLEAGAMFPKRGRLVAAKVMKASLNDVSRKKLYNQLYAEYPEHRLVIGLFENGKSHYSGESLKVLLGASGPEFDRKVQVLRDIGFLGRSGNQNDYAYFVGPIYRNALGVTLGWAVADENVPYEPFGIETEDEEDDRNV